MPKPESGESMDQFMDKFMGDKRDKKWPKKQRAAVGYSEWRDRKKKKRDDEHAE
jgi:DNA-binding ferritin-like protein (Dps family)